MHVLTRIERLSSGRVTQLRYRGTETGIAVECADRLTRRERDEIARQASWMFALEADFEEFYAQADAEPRLRHCRLQAHGRLLRSPSLWEDVVKVLLTTNIQWGGTKRLAQALVGHFGEPMPDPPPNRPTPHSTGRAFPTPERIARSREATLRKLGLGYRAPYLLRLARGVADGAFDLEALKDPTRSTDDLRCALVALPGIGPYAAHTLLFLLGRYDFIGVDTEAISLVSRHFYDGGPVGKKEVEAAFARWGKYKALAYWFWDYRS